ncbi:proline-rich protein 36-like [Hypomesus transpacificus]|uniref:proline-rich protein 36-like n=1 Tax=Hypomesus transpacificus TaxID=137520 RepID=UPI001F07E839|nr:proline-rich protein 36-like [Hypomesus transpacificus]
MQWQQELEQQTQQQPAAAAGQKAQSAVQLSPSSGLCTIYEALENSEEEDDDDEEDDHVVKELSMEENGDLTPTLKDGEGQRERRTFIEEQEDTDPSVTSSCHTTPPPDSPPQVEPRHPSPGTESPEGESPPPPESPERPPPPDLDWGKKVDIVQQLINQTLLLAGDGCSSLLLLPGGGGGTLSPLESSLWPNLAPLTPPSATVTSVSSFSPEAPGSSPQGEWTVVELETHH